MPNYFCVSVTFLDPVAAFHGRGNAGRSEWPPSPLRLFQALLASAASRWQEPQFLSLACPAFEWLQEQNEPLLIAPRSRDGHPICIAVPNNDMDVPATAWAKHREPKKQPNELKTLKKVCPIRLMVEGNDPSTVYYLWPLTDDVMEFEQHKAVLSAAARGVTHLGWGIDMAVADASVISEPDIDKLPGERWMPTEDRSARDYRVPTEGTITALMARHKAFLNRLGPDGFNPVAPLTTFRTVSYRRATDQAQRSFAAFNILNPDGSGFRSFGTAHEGVVVAGMMRHAASDQKVIDALAWPPEMIAAFILGHAEQRGQSHMPVSGPRLAYIPLPSIESRGDGPACVAGLIRRAMIVVVGGHAQDELQQLAQLLSGTDLIGETSDKPVALLSRIPQRDRMVRRYTDPAATWATVTPVILPGYDDPRKLRQRLFSKSRPNSTPRNAKEQKELLAKLDKRIDFLLRKAIRQAGVSCELARNARIEWRKSGFWPGTDLATQYAFPNKLRRFRRLHVRITWRDVHGEPLPLPGPFCLGRGRFYGLGLFAALESP